MIDGSFRLLYHCGFRRFKSMKMPSFPLSKSSILFYVFVSASLLLTWQGAGFLSVSNLIFDDPAIPIEYFLQQQPKLSYALAYNQSFGFFDNIPDSDWKIAQTLHAKAFPNHFREVPNEYSSKIEDKANIAVLKKSPFWYAENFQEEFHCEYEIRSVHRAGVATSFQSPACCDPLACHSDA